MTSKAPFKQSDLTRAIRGTLAAGLTPARVEIDARTGRIVILTGDAASKDAANPWDEVLE